MPDGAIGAVEKLGTAFAAFREINDQRLDELEKKGAADPLLDDQLAKMNASIEAAQDEMTTATKRADEMEARINRDGLGGGAADQAKERAEAAWFFGAIQGSLVTDPDMEAFRSYKAAFNTWMRRGDAAGREVFNALEVGSDPDGGYWVLPDTSGRIATLLNETSPIREIAFVQPIGTDALEGPNDLDQAAAGGWVAEKAARAETGTPQTGMWKIVAEEQYANPRATQKMLEDGIIDVEAWLGRKIAEILALTENTAFVNGTGVGQPRGFLTYPSGVPTSSSWEQIEQVVSGAAADFAATDPGDPLITLMFKLKAAYRQGARWVMNRTTVGKARQLKDGNGNYLWQPNFEERQGGLLLGHGITEAEDMPDVGAGNLAIAFGNFEVGYTIVDRQGIRVLRDPFTAKPFVQFYTTKRTGGGVTNFESIKLFKIST